MPPKKRPLVKGPQSPAKKSKDSNESPQKDLKFYFSRDKGKGKARQEVDEVIELSSSESDSDKKAPTSDKSPNGKLTQEERDSRLAIELARAEGIDIEQLRRQERDVTYARKLAQSPDVEAGTSKVSVSPTKGSTAQLGSPTKQEPTSPTSKLSSFLPTSNAASQPDQVAYPLDKDILAFHPTIDIDTSTWPRNRDKTLQIPYSFLTAAFVLISATRSRLLITTILTNTLRTISQYQPEALVEAIYLITNHVAPSYEGVELGIGGQILNKAIKEVSGISAKEMKSLWNQVCTAFPRQPYFQ
jgi:DNA ligase-1